MSDNEMVFGLLRHVKQEEPMDDVRCPGSHPAAGLTLCPLCGGRDHDTTMCPLAPNNERILLTAKAKLVGRKGPYRAMADRPTVDVLDDHERRIEELEMFAEARKECSGDALQDQVRASGYDIKVLRRSGVGIILAIISVIIVTQLLAEMLYEETQEQFQEHQILIERVEDQHDALRRIRRETER